MLDLGTIELADEHVRLRPLHDTDAPALAMAASENRDQYGYTPVPDGLEQTERYVREALAARQAGARYPFVIEHHARVVGTSSYYDYQPWRWPWGSPHARNDRPHAVEIGYTWLAASAQHTDCNTRAKRLLLRHAFDGWQVFRVALRTDARNVRSRAAIERLGARHDGILRAHTYATDGGIRDTAYYSILASEWPYVKAELDRKLARRH